MLSINWLRTTAQRLLTPFVAILLIFAVVGCGNPGPPEFPSSSRSNPPAFSPTRSISEVSPPVALQQLRRSLEGYQPQVKILSPRPDEVLEDTSVAIQLQVQDLPIFKDADLDLGPYLQIILDNQPKQAVYNTSQPLVLSDLTPGTHTLQVFASRPWHESFKNEGAYAQTTFHIFTKTQDNLPDPTLPLLTYHRPQGTYGTEPILLDFYLTNAPLHIVAQENPEDAITDWRIRVTVNGESFVIDQWQPFYLKGFKPGKNWVRLEFLDENGNLLKNAFNDTARLFTYEPNGQDSLSKIIRGELTVAEARGIVDPRFTATTPTVKPVVAPSPAPELEILPSPEPTPIVEETPSFEPTPIVEETPSSEPTPIVEETPSSEPTPIVEETPSSEPTPIVEETPSSEPAPITEEVPVITPAPTPIVQETPKPAPSRFPQPKQLLEKLENLKAGQFFNRFLHPSPEPSPVNPSSPPTLPEIVKEAPVPEATELTPSGQSPELVPIMPQENTVETPTQRPGDAAIQSTPEETVTQPES